MATLLWVVVSTTFFFAGFAVGRRNEQRKLEALVGANDMLGKSSTYLMKEIEEEKDSRGEQWKNYLLDPVEARKAVSTTRQPSGTGQPRRSK
jgi:hypothetical protein